MLCLYVISTGNDMKSKNNNTKQSVIMINKSIFTTWEEYLVSSLKIKENHKDDSNVFY